MADVAIVNASPHGKKLGRIASARVVVADLVASGMYLSPGVVEQSLTIVGE